MVSEPRTPRHEKSPP